MDVRLKEATIRLRAWIKSPAPAIAMQMIWPHPKVLREDIRLLIEEVEKHQ